MLPCNTQGMLCCRHHQSISHKHRQHSKPIGRTGIHPTQTLAQIEVELTPSMVYFAESRSKLKLTLGKIGRRLTHRKPMKDHLILWKNLVEKSWSLHLLPTAAWCGRTVPLVGQGRVPTTSRCCRPSSTTLRRE